MNRTDTGLPGSSLSTRALWEVTTAQTVVPSSRVTRTSASISPSWTLCTLPEKWLRALVGASPVLMMTHGALIVAVVLMPSRSSRLSALSAVMMETT